MSVQLEIQFTPSPVNIGLTAIQDAEATWYDDRKRRWLGSSCTGSKPASNGGQMITGYRLHISKNNRDLRPMLMRRCRYGGDGPDTVRYRYGQ